MNNVTIVGTVQDDPELKFTASGTALANFTVRIGRKLKENAGGDGKADYEYFDVTAWKDLGEHVAESLRKGDRVIVCGPLKQQKWETAEGEKRSKVGITAWNVGPDLSYATAVVTHAERREPEAQNVSAGEAPF